MDSHISRPQPSRRAKLAVVLVGVIIEGAVLAVLFPLYCVVPGAAASDDGLCFSLTGLEAAKPLGVFSVPGYASSLGATLVIAVLVGAALAGRRWTARRY